ncbi:SEC14-like protein 2 [Folsomia candida]|uniref:SEC14-like protein 2 n=1 Tax=Folsomia candida TaxID=158441 RepID=UPI000B8FB12E|nr:SEC14-like protein 2 [Folsomia candida]XP_035710361.1 SEC14-like protein 2 [Folsomia candida]
MSLQASQHEMEMVAQLKARLENNDQVGPSWLKLGDDAALVDLMFLRFLRARDLNLNKAEEMLTKYLKWREENEIDSLHAWTPPAPLSRKNYPYEITGVDKEGCPVLVVAFGQWDIRRVCELGVKSEYIRYVDQLFANVTQAMAASSAERSNIISQFIIVFVPDDLAAFRQMSCRQAVDAVLETVRRFEANHPETLKRAFVIDTPKVFQVIFSGIRPFINSKTLGKVLIAGGSREWLPVLHDLVEPHNLPARLGGSYVSKCEIFNKTRLRTSPASTLQRVPSGDSAAFICRTIPAGNSISIEYHVSSPRTQLSWTFKTERWDIGFSILYDATQVVVPFSRLGSDDQLQSGSVLCQHSGIYVLVFDNTFSRWRSKVVQYRVVLRSEDEDNKDDKEVEVGFENDDAGDTSSEENVQVMEDNKWTNEKVAERRKSLLQTLVF